MTKSHIVASYELLMDFQCDVARSLCIVTAVRLMLYLSSLS